MQTEITTINLAPLATHKYSVIWLHGLGADGHDFERIVPELHLLAEANIHFIFPNAPIQPVTINNHMKMRAWYDILTLSPDSHTVDTTGIYQSSELINAIIASEIDKGIPAERILLAGFSQGGVIALHCGLRYPEKLAGILALSTYLPTIDQLRIEGSVLGKTTPIFLAHGILDAIIAVEMGKTTYNELCNLGYLIQWHDYVMEHAVCPEEIKDIASFMNAVFS